MTGKISIIIVAYVNIEDIKNCIESIGKYNDAGENVEIIVVDNSPNMKLYEFVQQHYPFVSLIKNENTGFGDANNKGAEIAKGDILFFLNPDTILVEPLFQHIVQRMQDSTIGILGFNLLKSNLKKNSSYNWIDKEGLFYNQIMKIFKKLNYFNGEKMYIEGANMILRKEVFDAAGRFDKNLFMYFEEQDLSKRVLKLGYKSVYDASHSLIHLQGGSSSSETSLMHELNSLKYYCNKYDINFQQRVAKKIRAMKLKKFIFKFINQEKHLYYVNSLKKYEEVCYDN